MATTTSTSSTSSTSSSTSSTSSSTSSISTSLSSTSASTSSTSSSTSSTSLSTSSTSSSVSSTSSSISSTSTSSTSSSTSVSSTSSSISSTSVSSTSTSSTSSSTSKSSTSTSFSSTSSSVSSTSASTSSTSVSSTSSSSSTSTTAIPLNLDYSYQDSLTLPATVTDDIDPDVDKNYQNLAVDDGDYFVQYGSEYMIETFKFDWTNSTDTPSFTYKGRSTYDTRISPLLIQIWNPVSSAGPVIDSYKETNQDNNATLDPAGGNAVKVGQSFTGNGSAVGSAVFYINKFSTPTGNATAKIYAHSGTFGTSSVPTGAALATSDAFDVSTLTTSFQLITFTFSGANQITLTNGTRYVVTLEYPTDVSGLGLVRLGEDSSSPTASGNYWDSQFGADSTIDLCFYVQAAGAWETLAVVNTVPPDTDFTRTVTQSTNVSNYYDAKSIVSFRVYQQVI